MRWTFSTETAGRLRCGSWIGALYRRYANKQGLLRALCTDGLQRYVREVEAALADPREPRVVLQDFIRRVVDADTHSLTLSLAGTFEPDERLWLDAARASQLNRSFYDKMKADGALRADVEVEDFAFIFEQLATIQGPTAERTAALRCRYLELTLQALQATSAMPLPGPAPTEAEIAERWTVKRPHTG